MLESVAQPLHARFDEFLDDVMHPYHRSCFEFKRYWM